MTIWYNSCPPLPIIRHFVILGEESLALMILILLIFIILLSCTSYQYFHEKAKKEYFVISMSEASLWQAITSKWWLLMSKVIDDPEDLVTFHLTTLLRTHAAPSLEAWLSHEIGWRVFIGGQCDKLPPDFFSHDYYIWYNPMDARSSRAAS